MASIRRHLSLRMGRDPLYQIRIHTRSGKVRTAGHGVKDKREAASLADAMEKSINR